jgi:hypothetical protein
LLRLRVSHIPLVLLLTALAATACGGHERASACRELSAQDLQAVGAALPSRREALARAPGSQVSCSIVFIDSAGQLILQVTETDGGRAALEQVRRAVAASTTGSVGPLPALGAGAFVSRRATGFAHGGRVVELQTGYAADGHLELSRAELVRLARVARTRT